MFDNMPGQTEFTNLFRSENIFGAIKNLDHEIVGQIKAGNSSSILLDNSTVSYALRFLSGEKFSKSKIIPNKEQVYVLAVYELISALILYETIYMGPGSEGTYYYREDLRATQNLLREADTILSWKQIFTVLNLARQRAIQLMNDDADIASALNSILEKQLVKNYVLKFLEELTPNASYHSPHHWDDLFSEGVDKYFYFDLSIGLLGSNTISMNAVDEANLGKYWGNNDYFGYLGKRSGVKFPEDHLDEYYAASLLFRVLVYLFVSELTGCTYHGDALRAELAKAIVVPTSKRQTKFAEIVISHLANDEKKRDETVNLVLGYEAFKLNVPLVAGMVLARSKSIEDVLKVTLELRESKPATRFRSYCSSIDEAVISGNRTEVEAALQELSSYGIKIVDEFEKDNKDFDIPLQVTQELVKLGSPLIATIWPLIKFPAKQLAKKIHFRKLAFLDQIRTAPRTVGILERELLRLKQK